MLGFVYLYFDCCVYDLYLVFSLLVLDYGWLGCLVVVGLLTARLWVWVLFCNSMVDGLWVFLALGLGFVLEFFST